MELDFRNKMIDNQKYYVIDMWVNGVSINSVSEIKRIKTYSEKYDMVVFITSSDIEHHVQQKSILEIVGTFYDENWNQLSWDEMNIKTQLLEQINNLEEL